MTECKITGRSCTTDIGGEILPDLPTQIELSVEDLGSSVGCLYVVPPGRNLTQLRHIEENGSLETRAQTCGDGQEAGRRMCEKGRRRRV